MKIDAPNLNYLWAQLMIEELIRNGVTHFFVAPGSRSSPLALAVAGNKEAKIIVHFDERGLAFAALGCARATGVPAAVITTSGTAVANLFPAVIEASMDHVPMILLTGDRPPELRDCGANQAIDQVKIFGDYVRWFFDVPCPDEKIPPRFVLTTIDQAVALAATGPVHLNCQFREPLAPVRVHYGKKGATIDLKNWLVSGKPFTAHEPSLKQSSLGWMLDDIPTNRRTKGLIVVSERRDTNDAREIMELAAEIQWPVLADVRSCLRTDLEQWLSDTGIALQESAGRYVVGHADQLLLSPRFAQSYRPEVVFQFGGRLLSKRMQTWLNESRPRVYSIISTREQRADAAHVANHYWRTDLPSACHLLRPILDRTAHAKWLNAWLKADVVCGKAVKRALKHAPLSEPWIAAVLSELVPYGHSYVLANSMPVRDADMYSLRMSAGVAVFANRGASGIDGTIATAVGAALGSGEGVTLVIGDLALLHDLNSLAVVREMKKPFVIVAINNDGGAIFSFLPVAKHPEHFEKVFGTPHGLGFKSAAEMFGLAYENPATAKDFESAYREACTRNVTTLIEVRTNRKENVRIHREIQNAVRKAVDRVA